MKFKLDENMPADLAVLLRTHGHDAMGVVEQGLAGEDDPPVLEHAAREDRILITFDLDFADTVRERTQALLCSACAINAGKRWKNQLSGYWKMAVFSHSIAAWLLLTKSEFAGNGPEMKKKANGAVA